MDTITISNRYTAILRLIIVFIGLYALSRVNYLLFHALAEMFSVLVAGTIFALAWNARRFLSNGFLLFIGIAYAFIGGIDLIHTLAYQGMGVFENGGANLPTQLWIAARYLQAISFLFAFVYLRRPLRPEWVFVLYSAILGLIFLSIFSWQIFPTAYIEGSGLTNFKIASEYIISLLLAASLGLLWLNRSEFAPRVLRMIAVSLGLSILTELTFTAYMGVFDFANLLGHLLKIAAYYMIFRAIVVTGFVDPFNLMFRSLKTREADLRRAHDELELRVQERTAEVIAANLALSAEIEEHRQTETELQEYKERLEELVEERTQELQREVSERKRVEAEAQLYARRLERSNRDLEDFAFIASHDLQEPLRKIIAFGDRLARSELFQGNEVERDYVERMQSAAYRMRVLLNDLLLYSRVSTQQQAFLPVDLSEILAGVVQDLEISLDQTQGKVVLDDLPELEADPVQMRQLFQNLIGNAIKYHREGVQPVVKVHGQVVQDQETGEEVLNIFVEDNGIGFEEQHAEKIFQPFQRLVGRSQYDGSGMGLTICRKIVERHEGEITAVSTPGKGSTFIVKLPLRQTPSMSKLDLPNPG